MAFDSEYVLNLRAQSGVVSTHPASYSKWFPSKPKDKELQVLDSGVAGGL